MRGKDILKEALNLDPAEKFIVVEGLLKSLDEPDSELDKIWADEAERRLEAYRDGKLKGIPMEEIFNPLK
ncbi:addiction module protein [Desulfoprunum benzoelyticum]|uniref:Putative addiction module component (TIGR02574 family) n=1 Tax=Desulfoprunum benzoelyticum TaxID=1506996 RepID=A0A840UL01_9BACT|nr:addiction module protein [Desulfoprunum benzoelyticum]MBB5346997.1 putative addiction module component (TIGR02574 family) [Desulfoprunum benzoelyticum]MBM9531635.1 addiction module protein [Desulfoprunum benzoelyticum]